MAVSIPVFQGETGCQCIYSGLNQKCFIISFLFVTMIQNKQLIKYFPSIACVEYFEEWLRKTCINSYHVIQGEAWRGYLFVGFQVLQPSRNFYTWEYVHASIFFLYGISENDVQVPDHFWVQNTALLQWLCF